MGDVMTIKQILVPTDFSADSDAAIAYAIDLARHFGGIVHLLHVVENPFVTGVWSTGVYAAEIAGLTINLARDAEERLRRSRPCLFGRLESEVRTGPVARTIADVARETAADLIVMGTAGRTGVSHLVMGSVAERVVRSAPCPVLTIRAARQSTTSDKRKEAIAEVPA